MVKVKRKPVPYEENHKDINGVIYKLCSDCNKWIPMEEGFYKNKSAPDGHNPYCKECTKNKSAKWIKENPEKYRKSKMKYRRTENGRIQNRKWNSEYTQRGKRQEWIDNNKDKLYEYGQNRIANKKHIISKNEWENCKNYFNYRCAYCGLAIENHYIKFNGKIRLGDFHREHVYDDGANDLSNCIPSCKSCNCRKNVFTLEEWYREANPMCECFSQERLEKIHKWLNEDYKLYMKI